MTYHKATKKAVKKEPIPRIKVQVCWESCLSHEPSRCDQHHDKVKYKTSQAIESNYPCKDTSNNRQKRPAANKKKLGTITSSITRIIIFLRKTKDTSLICIESDLFWMTFKLFCKFSALKVGMSLMISFDLFSDEPI